MFEQVELLEEYIYIYIYNSDKMYSYHKGFYNIWKESGLKWSKEGSDTQTSTGVHTSTYYVMCYMYV